MDMGNLSTGNSRHGEEDVSDTGESGWDLGGRPSQEAHGRSWVFLAKVTALFCVGDERRQKLWVSHRGTEWSGWELCFTEL